MAHHNVCFTGRGHDMNGEFMERGDWERMAISVGCSISPSVNKYTDVLVASRNDTIKAIGAQSHGIVVMNYPQFQQWCLDHSGMGSKYPGVSPTVDPSYFERRRLAAEQAEAEIKAKLHADRLQHEAAERLAEEAKRQETAHYEANPAFGMF